MSKHDPLVYELQARVKELEAECAMEFSLAGEVECLEARVKELHESCERWIDIAGRLGEQVKELKAERDDLLRLGNNHK